ncbi:MAG: hypothetical protein H5T73_11490 [Actinobacteria bacterium]|nr:hypothetical protein [Actinomycetota bacterium]
MSSANYFAIGVALLVACAVSLGVFIYMYAAGEGSSYGKPPKRKTSALPLQQKEYDAEYEVALKKYEDAKATASAERSLWLILIIAVGAPLFILASLFFILSAVAKPREG